VTTQTFDVQMLAPQTLHPYYRNNKTHDKQQITLLARVLRVHGFDQPIVVDKDLVIIKGHGRWAAAMEANMITVPVVVRADLEDWQVQAARIADNQSFAMSEIDAELSRAEVNEFVKNGGVGAEFYFDFLRPPAKSTDPHNAPGNAVVSAMPKINVGGLLCTCPKCQNVFMEVKS
jgi:hypothetical protein